MALPPIDQKSTSQLPTVCAVVVTFNRLELLQECVVALRAQTRRLDGILVVNNGSTDGTRAWLETQPDLELIHQANVGGAGGFSAGMKHAYAQNFSWVWLMDDDVIAEAAALQELLGTSVSQQTVGYLASRVVTPEGAPINMPLVDTRRTETAAPRWAEYASEGVIGIRTATFVSVLVPRESIQRLGFPIKEMFIWGDDTEYTFRLSKLRPSYLVGKSTVAHKRASAKNPRITTESAPGRIQLYFYLIRNNIYWMLREKESKQLVFFLVELVRDLFASLTQPLALLRLKVILRGVYHGIFFRPVIDVP